ncbi:hypothetical protein SS1G_01415 [Sclerotinia sclerotiorum 1980 UF-70]|uniref:C3H1-type domain-containing protein n=1 Tax=Sclerotinia sclerotiorum (strain ATCC 18683 / 1980 / Ss-1) TaxID=665079 RepID=A7E7Y7_SCLS1|nr:hypothetical protein SS1G_01415 [Sclerotinia sclerotiorum 1980 UF-70]EDN96489.1 hypothetical protein SS1G_01415 [Sclerotinia sclerotiorum 1980 UF-70]
MASEDQAILERISRIAGQINQHKNHQSTDQYNQAHSPASTNSLHPQPSKRGGHGAYAYHPYANNSWRGSRGSHRGAYSARGYRGARGGGVGIVRHRTLVLNGGTPASPSQPDSSNVTPSTDENERSSSACYITKTDRHLQLINKSYFEKDSQIRVKAIEETRRQKLKQRDEREKLKLSRHLQRLGANFDSSKMQPTGTSNYEVTVNGIRFMVTKNGSKLVKASGDLTSANATPKTALIGGVKFYRSKNGNMYREGIIKATRTPNCLHFAKGNCSNPDCRYTHVRVSPTALVCHSFGIYGYCDKGITCTERHIHECPDFSNTGTCTTKGCKLPHRIKASVIRRNAAAGDSSPGDQSSDVSSDEEDEIGSDDVDSDVIDEEFFGDEDGEMEPGVLAQQDYVQFS